MSSSSHDRPLRTIVGALGVAQIIAWGSLHYSIAVLAQPMARTLEVGVPTVLAAFSGALLASGLASPLTGRLLDRHGGRLIMAAGSLLAAASLGLIALASHPAVFISGWILAGVAMAATLYDAAFATVVALSGGRHRQALTALTLLGGLASTVFWPLTYVLDQTWGWRAALAVFAALHLLVCAAAPVAGPTACGRRLASSRGQRQRASDEAEARRQALVARRIVCLRRGHFLCSVGAHARHAAIVRTDGGSGGDRRRRRRPDAGGGTDRRVSRRQPRQSNLRGSHRDGGHAGRAGAAVAVREAGWIAFAYAALYGASNGVLTIVRGTVPAGTFRSRRLRRPARHARRASVRRQAAAPVAFALVATQRATSAPSRRYRCWACCPAGLSIGSARARISS
jgi:hypothetical protein